MAKYFSLVTADHWTAKNNAEKQAKQVAYNVNRLLIDESEIVAFKHNILKQIDQVNANNPRCKDLELLIWNPMERDDIYFQILSVFYLTLYKVREP